MTKAPLPGKQGGFVCRCDNELYHKYYFSSNIPRIASAAADAVLNDLVLRPQQGDTPSPPPKNSKKNKKPLPITSDLCYTYNKVYRPSARYSIQPPVDVSSGFCCVY